MNLILHEQTKKQLVHFLANPSHAVLLAGPAGIGKCAIAEHVASKLLAIEPQTFSAYPYLLHIEPDEKGTIPIALVRDVQKFLQLKTVGQNEFRRVVLIENADCLTREAQNAYLKLLEEPPADTLMVLTTQHKRRLLPTILSRAQIISVHIPDNDQITTYFTEQDQTKVTQARFLSGGLPGLMQALLEGETEHPLMQGVVSAKALLVKNQFERLAIVDQLSKQKNELTQLLEALLRISISGLDQAASKSEAGKMRQWHAIRKEVMRAQDALAKSANTKLVLTSLFLHL